MGSSRAERDIEHGMENSSQTGVANMGFTSDNRLGVSVLAIGIAFVTFATTTCAGGFHTSPGSAATAGTAGPTNEEHSGDICLI